MKKHPLKHLHTIRSHKRNVLKNACKMGIFFHALKHDISKYSFREFNLSSKYWTGVVSPVNKEREEKGNFSLICQHHTKRNPHHWEYWTDFYKGNVIVMTMPYKYAVEYVCDMISASKVYGGKSFTRESTLNYFLARVDHYFVTQATREFITWCLTQYAESEWKHLRKDETRAKYKEITSKLPQYETIKITRTQKEN